MPSGKRTPVALSTPERWKSLMRTASSWGRPEASKIPSASFSAGPNLVVPAAELRVGDEPRQTCAVGRGAGSGLRPAIKEESQSLGRLQPARR